MQAEFAQHQLKAQQQLLKKLTSFEDPNERYAFLCCIKGDFDELTKLVADFEESRNVSRIESLLESLKVE